AVNLRVIKTQAHTDSKKTTDAVTTTVRFLRWKVLRRSRNVGSLSGRVFNWSPLPSLKCISRGAGSKWLFMAADRPGVGLGSGERELPISSFGNRFEQGSAATICRYTGWHHKFRTLQQHGEI